MGSYYVVEVDLELVMCLMLASNSAILPRPLSCWYLEAVYYHAYLYLKYLLKFVFICLNGNYMWKSTDSNFNFCRRSTYNHLSSWLTDARNLTNPNTVS
jgi:hypothetical protein